MQLSLSALFFASVLLVAASPSAQAQAAAEKSPAASAQARPVTVPAVILDKKGPVTTLAKGDFALTVDGKPQPISTFERGGEAPLTVGLLVDVGRGQGRSLDEEEKASEAFLTAVLGPAKTNGSREKAFVMQFGRTAELLQDVTDAAPQLNAGLKQVGTQAPGSSDDDSADDKKADDGRQDSNAGRQNNGGYGRSRGPYGGNRTGGSDRPRASGTVLYDAIFLASEDVAGKQKGRRVLVLLTQGVDRHSKESLKEAIDAAQRNDTVLYAIYLRGDARNVSGANPGARDSDSYGYPGGYGGYGYPYPPTTGGGNGDGTYTDPDGKKILDRLCGETGGHMFEAKGKNALEPIFKQIADELHAQYRLGFTPSADAASPGYHKLQLTLTNEAAKKYDVQTRDGYLIGEK